MSATPTLTGIYGSKELLDENLRACAQGIQYTERDAKEINLDSFVQVLKEMGEAGLAKRKPTPDQLTQWSPSLDENLADLLIQTLQNKIDRTAANDLGVITVVGETLHQFENEQTLGKAKHKISHLFANYLCLYFGRPFLIFSQGEKERYFQALHSTKSCSELVFEKFRESMIYEGEFLERKVATPFTDRYGRADEKKPIVSVEWHNVVRHFNTESKSA